jgi:hypothetical protein
VSWDTREFDGIKLLFGEYQDALKKVYTVPRVPEFLKQTTPGLPYDILFLKAAQGC